MQVGKDGAGSQLDFRGMYKKGQRELGEFQRNQRRDLEQENK